MARKKVVIPSSMESTRVIEKTLLELVRQEAYSEAAVFAIRLAVEEAVINAIKHGNKSDVSKNVIVEMDVDARRAKICVTDHGEGFDPSKVPDPTIADNLEKPSGRGLMLMRAYMDEVHFTPKGERVCLIKQKR